MFSTETCAPNVDLVRRSIQVLAGGETAEVAVAAVAAAAPTAAAEVGAVSAVVR